MGTIGKPFTSGNAGRPKGSQNKTAKSVKEMMQLFCEASLPKIMARMDELSLKEIAQLSVAFSAFFLPKTQILETKAAEPIDPRYEKLSFDQLQRIESIITGEPKLIEDAK
jgi:hypothetical protein